MQPVTDPVVYTQALEARFDLLSSYKFFRYFPDCTPDCQKDSPRKEDHAGFCRTLYVKHTQFMAAGAVHRERLFLAGNRIGKAQPDDELVLTPHGFVRIDSLRVGDRVIGSNGRPVTVVGVFPQGVRPVAKVVCNDGSTVRCDYEHLWTVRPIRDGQSAQFVTMTTGEISRQILDHSHRFALPQRPMVLFEGQELPVDPYLLGLLIGDGHLGQGVKITTCDKEIVTYCRDIAPEYGCRLSGGENGSITYWFATTLQGPTGHPFNLLLDLLRTLNLHGCNSHKKRIPAIYLTASESDRRALLAGLMDTDGHSSPVSGSRVFYSVNRDLCEDVSQLARSLGINCSVREKRGRYKGEPHRSWITYLAFDRHTVFRLPRKKANETGAKIRLRPVVIEGIELAGEAECRCIKVDAADGLYVTKDFLVTHNTETVAFEAVAHATGLYPEWWKGRKFDRAVRGWASGDTMLTTRDILQVALLGPIDGVDTEDWKGMIPKHMVLSTTRKSGGVAKCIDQIWVKHVSGETSIIEFKSHDSGRRAFQGTEQDFVILDEEPPDDVYTECLLRTMTTEGLILCSMTPLQGLTPFIQQYLETAVMPDSEGELRQANTVFWPGDAMKGS